MTGNIKDSKLDLVFKVLDMIWSPGAEARKVQKSLNVKSLEDTVSAVERAGYEVCYVDLPESVSGFATVIEGKPFIAVNRTKPRYDVPYTVSHELGHQVLHLNPSRRPDPLGIPSNEGLQEFQAHMFAASWVFWAANGKEKDDALRPTESLILALAVFVSLGVIVTAIGCQLWSRFFRPVPKQ